MEDIFHIVRLSVVLCLFLNKCDLTSCEGSSNRTIITNVSEKLVLNCSQNGTRWQHNSKGLFAGKNYLLNDREMDLIEDSYSLVIKEVSISNEGRYECKENDEVVASYCIEVNVPPSSFYMEVNNDNVSDGNYVVLDYEDTIAVSCSVIGARPPNVITWTINNETVKPFNYSFLTSNNETFDSVSSILYKPNTLNGTITCRRSSLTQFGHEITLNFITNENIEQPSEQPTTRQLSILSSLVIAISSACFLLAITLSCTVICVRVPFYVYLEYMENGTLRNFMLRNYQQKRDSENISNSQQRVSSEEQKLNLVRFSVDVVEGMSYLFVNKFRHPALTTSKVLISVSTGKCKLYDFVPEDHAKDRLLRIIAKKNAPLAWLPPESIFFRQYCEKSDVWSLSVALWEIFSLGETPYSGLSGDEIESHIRNGSYLSQPMSCPGTMIRSTIVLPTMAITHTSIWKNPVATITVTYSQDLQ
ncbi:uncharacterized protein [Apostichopus japonicus]|uniref:uncharacterized protein isoform X2 n=1 Tax=Stichopus japonicus TaxID=307972 RepID=UPI003AB6AA78